jgi:hypothetical protein
MKTLWTAREAGISPQQIEDRVAGRLLAGAYPPSYYANREEAERARALDHPLSKITISVATEAVPSEPLLPRFEELSDAQRDRFSAELRHIEAAERERCARIAEKVVNAFEEGHFHSLLCRRFGELVAKTIRASGPAFDAPWEKW